MNVIHCSDLHGELDVLNPIAEGWEPLPDLFILTGDILPNFSQADRDTEIELQPRWVERTAEDFKRIFQGRPVLFQKGNHCFVWPDEIWRNHGINVTRVTRECQKIFGISYAGFHEVNFIKGEWDGETHNPEMTAIVDEVMGNNPDLLITHAPPKGIMDGLFDSYGVKPLIDQLTHRPNKVKYHLFGHCHLSTGIVEEKGIVFSNAATGYNVLKLSPNLF